MPLDLSQYTSSTDTPEVAALKAKVKEVAAVYTKRHGWCGEVNKALREIGIDPPTIRIPVTVKTKQGIDLTLRLAVCDLVGKDEEAQKAYAYEKIGNKIEFAGANHGIGSLSFAASDIVDLTTPEKVVSTGTGPRNTESGAWVYTSDTGRVLHFVEGAHIEDTGTVSPPSGRIAGYGAGRIFNAHGDYSYGIYTTSRSGQGTDCTRCSRSLL